MPEQSFRVTHKTVVTINTDNYPEWDEIDTPAKFEIIKELAAEDVLNHDAVEVVGIHIEKNPETVGEK